MSQASSDLAFEVAGADGAADGSPVAVLLHVLIVGLIVANVFTQLTTVMRAFLSNFMVRNMDFSMMSGFLKHALSLPIPFFAKRKTGDIFARFQENQTIRAFLTESTISTVLNLLMVFIYFSILFMYSVKMTSLLVLLVIPILVLTVAVTPKLKAYARDTFQASTDAESTLMEIIGGAETVKGMGIERPMRLKWEKKYTNALDVRYRAQRFNILVGLASQLFNATISIVILWTGANLVLAQELTIGQLIAFNALMGSVLSPLMGLVALWNRVHEAGVAMERLGDILEMEPEQKPEEIGSRVLLPDLKGDIDLKGVYFRYGGNETPYVLENISFSMRAGELVAIVGQSGSGKTTLAKLLVGFYLPSEGALTVDGYDLTVIDKEYYRAQIGYVMQSNLLFSGSIAENIASGEENPDRNRIIEVAKEAGIPVAQASPLLSSCGDAGPRQRPLREPPHPAVHSLPAPDRPDGGSALPGVGARCPPPAHPSRGAIGERGGDVWRGGEPLSVLMLGLQFPHHRLKVSRLAARLCP